MSKNNLTAEISDINLLLKKLVSSESQINLIIEDLTKCIKSGKKILICGNGGSAGEANHLAAEFIVRLKPKNNRNAIPMISLSQNSSVLTACGNDFGFENIFSRQLEALASETDIVFLISTSGMSPNIINAAKKAITFNELSRVRVGSF